jgi:hypothetical protein
LHDQLERLFRRLVTNLAALDPASLDRAFPVANIADRLVPYRTHRTALGFDTNEDYELCLLRLLSGERGLAWVTPDDVREALAREVIAPNPDTALYRQFPGALVLLDPERVADALGSAADAALAARERERRGPHFSVSGPAAYPAPPSEPAFEPVEADDDAAQERAAAAADLPFTLDDDDAVAPVRSAPRSLPAGSGCGYCGGALPVGRSVLFCPHCGQNVGVVHCPTCSAELDVGWKFCVACGQKVTGLG